MYTTSPRPVGETYPDVALVQSIRVDQHCARSETAIRDVVPVCVRHGLSDLRDDMQLLIGCEGAGGESEIEWLVARDLRIDEDSVAVVVLNEVAGSDDGVMSERREQ